MQQEGPVTARLVFVTFIMFTYYYNSTCLLYGCENWSVTLRETQTEGVRKPGVEEDFWA